MIPARKVHLPYPACKHWMHVVVVVCNDPMKGGFMHVLVALTAAPSGMQSMQTALLAQAVPAHARLPMSAGQS